ncbi:MAG: OOP family OmpA-OmpF porin [Vicingaceae bacterium]
MSVTKSILFVFCFLLCQFVSSQVVQGNLSAHKMKKMAYAAEYIKDWQSAAEFYEGYLAKKPADYKVLFRLAEAERKGGNYNAAQENYKILYERANDKFPLAGFQYAKMLAANGKCKEALPILKDFRKAYRGEKDERTYSRLAKFTAEFCENLSTIKTPKYSIKTLEAEINGSHIEGSPIYLDNKTIVYNSLKTKGKEIFNVDEDEIPKRKFYVAQKSAGSWQHKGEWPQTELFLQYEIANGAFNVERNRFYFSACEVNTLGKMACDIYVMQKERSDWKPAKKLSAAVNSPYYTETQVAIGKDEKERETIYFVSDRKEGKGGLDIWYSTYDEDKDTYKAARNCGSKINSVGDEMTPFFNPLNRTLFFSSDGHPNYGGLDVFKSSGARSKWLEPQNIGNEINTEADELYYVESKRGGEGIFASNRLKPGAVARFCCDDLYEFKDMNRIQVSVSGGVFDNMKIGADRFMEGVKVRLYKKDPVSKEEALVQTFVTQSDGKYSFQLEPDQFYTLKTEKVGFLIQEHDILTTGIEKSRRYIKNFALEYYIGRSIVVENIYYEFDKAGLTEASKTTIDTTIYEILIENPHIIIELSSHTDSEGTDSYNENLSQSRAESVVNYLIKKGIPKKRLTPKGYGESKPRAKNKNADGSDAPQGRAKNRRTEFKVIGEMDVEVNYED